MFVMRVAYNRLAGKYDVQIRKNLRNYDFILDNVASLLASKKNILDFGAGTGELAVLILKKNKKARLLCIDESEKMLEIAARKIAGSSRVKFLKANHVATKQKFDAIVSTFTLYLLDRKKILKEFARHMKKGSLLVLTDICCSSFVERLYSFAANIVQLVGGFPTAKFCNISDLEALLKENGFRKIKIKKLDNFLGVPVYLITALKA
jgi:ubiquinone/menaquinone biosynthesis C-methylase UbiE